MPHIITNDRGESIDLNTTEGQHRYVASALVHHGVHSQILAALTDLNRTAKRAERMETALRDAVSTYMGADKLVTAERIEAWLAALNGK